MKRPTSLLYRVLQSGGLQVNCAIERDFVEIRNRVKDEGMSFLTITLPTLCDVLDRGLSIGHVTPHMFHGFKPCKRGGSLPALLSGFFTRIFNSDGLLLDAPCIDSIRAIRQATRLFKKVELPCSRNRVKASFERYKSNDREVYGISDWHNVDISILSIIISHLWSDLEAISGELYCFPGKFGSGATAEKSGRNERLDILQWPSRSEGSFPSDYHASSSVDKSGCETLNYLSECEEQPVRVVQVPKTLKTPRIISVEPSYMLYMQQSVAKPLMFYLENYYKYKTIRFTDQSVNRKMAQEGSIDGSLATIDLKDASDLVSNELVQFIFKDSPGFLDLIQDCRTTRALLPDTSVIKLRKYASMGSALCFPIEAMVFFTIMCYSIVRQTGGVLSTTKLKRTLQSTSVYGDDVIIPALMAPGLMEDLEAFGLRVNHEKSFHIGSFRESCGGDYFRGHDVTPVYVRRWDFTGTLERTNDLVSYVSTSNQFYMKGDWHVADSIRKFIDKRHNGSIPYTKGSTGCLSYYSVLFTGPIKYDNKLHKHRVCGYVLSPTRVSDPIGTVDGAIRFTFLNRVHRQALQDFGRRLGRRPIGSRIPNEYLNTSGAQSLYESTCASAQGAGNFSEDFLTPNTLTEDRFGFENIDYRKVDYRFSGLVLPTNGKGYDASSDKPYSLAMKRKWCPVEITGYSYE